MKKPFGQINAKFDNLLGAKKFLNIDLDNKVKNKTIITEF